MNQNDGKSPQFYRFGPFVLDTKDTTNNRFLYYGEPLKLSNKPFLLLCTLVENRPNLLSIETLYTILRPEIQARNYPSDKYAKLRKTRQDYVYQQIRILRRTIGKTGEDPEDYVETSTGEGYRFKKDVEEVEIPRPPINLYEDLKFEEWTHRSPIGITITGLLSLGVGVTLVYLSWSFYHLITNNVVADFRGPLLLVQAILIVGMFIGSLLLFRKGGKEFKDHNPTFSKVIRERCGYETPEQWKEAKTRAKKALSQYSSCWISLLVAWSFLYPMLFLSRGRDTLHPLSIAATFFNNCNSLALALLYIVLNKPTAFATGGSERKWRIGSAFLKPVRLGMAIVLLFALAQGLLVFVSGRKLPVETVRWILERGDWVSGFAGAIAMALYVGRGQSRFLGYSPWLYLALYFYAAIQPLYPFIRNPISGELMIEAALICKCILYLHVAWLIKSGRLLFYFVRMRPIFERVNEDWKQFLLILDK